MKKIIKIFLNKVFIRYCIVGVIGTLIDLGILALLVYIFQIDPKTNSIFFLFVSIAFVCAVVNNFILNRFWTFGIKEKKDAFSQFIKFLIVSIFGLFISNICMYFFVVVSSIWFVFSKLITSGIVLIWNFLANKYWTFSINSLVPQILMQAGFFKIEFSIIIPAFNEEKRIIKTLESVYNFFTQKKSSFEIFIVNDGSYDDTKIYVKNFIRNNRIKNVYILSNSKNFGKGYSVRKGVKHSVGKYIMFVDADGSTPIQELNKCDEYLKLFDVIIGSRYLADSNIQIKQPWHRIAIGRIANFIIRMTIIEGIKDTQCGFKIFRHNAAKDIFSRMKINRFGFDMEALVLAEKLNYKIKEIPVSWYNSADSRVRPVKDTFRTFFDLMLIKINVWTGRYKKVKGKR